MNSYKIPRRRFLQRCGALAGAGMTAPAFIPASALGRDGGTAASERVTLGMLGTGRQAYLVNLGRQLLGMTDVQVVALCDVDRWRLQETKKLVEKKYGQNTRSGANHTCQTYQDYREVLGRADIDAVMISTPDHWHAPMAIAAAEAGKHVSLEKPITRTIREGRDIISSIRKNQVVFRMDSEMRSQKWLHRMTEIVRNGRLGKITAVRVGVPAGDDIQCPATPNMPVPKDLDYEMWQGPARRAPYAEARVHPPREFGRPGWMRVLNYCDGMVTNWGTHFWDIAQWCLNSEHTGPVEISGHGVWPDSGRLWNVLKRFEVTYRMADGTPLYYENTRNPEITGAQGKCQAYVKVEGTEGWIYGAYGPQQLLAEPTSLLETEIGPNEIHFPLRSDKEDFIHAIKTGGRTLEDEEVAHRITSICHLGHIAIHCGQPLTWDPVHEKFQNNDDANAYLEKPIVAPPG
jgi:myo-inositol 2-dehydrogenase/D-chiro-inositol 1-dehydrogenase